MSLGGFAKEFTVDFAVMRTEDVLGSVDVVLGYVVAHLKKEESKFCGGAP